VLKRTMLIILIVIIGMCAALIIYGYLSLNEPVIMNAEEELPHPEGKLYEKITITAIGDCLMHNTQIWSGQQADGSFNFDTFFTPVKQLIEEGDYCSANFEAPMAGPVSGYTGYPLFNSPDEIADTFKQAGIDLIITANNHILDKGYKGALRTMEVLHSRGLDTTGTYTSLEESQQFLIKDIRGVKVGYLAYSYSTNGIPVPAEHPYFFNYLQPEKVLQDIALLRPQVDVVVLVLHWGQEYQPRPTEEQRKMAYEFISAGADIILGSHPHVIQTMETIKIEDRDAFVIYSMGNFISHQRGQERNSGIVLKIELVKNFKDGRTKLKSVTYTPTYSHSYTDNGRTFFRVVPVEETINKIESGKEPYFSQSDLPVLNSVLTHTRNQLGDPIFYDS